MHYNNYKGPTLKLKRHLIVKKYAEQIDAMYVVHWYRDQHRFCLELTMYFTTTKLRPHVASLLVDLLATLNLVTVTVIQTLKFKLFLSRFCKYNNNITITGHFRVYYAGVTQLILYNGEWQGRGKGGGGQETAAVQAHTLRWQLFAGTVLCGFGLKHSMVKGR